MMLKTIGYGSRNLTSSTFASWEAHLRTGVRSCSLHMSQCSQSHSREMPSNNRYSSCLAPGGYIEIQDYELPLKSLDGSVEGTNLERWGGFLIEAAKKAGRPIGCCEFFKEWLENIGFVDIQQQVFVWPTNPWPKGDDEKTLGKWNLMNVTDGLEGFSLALLTRFLDWEKEEVDVLCAQVRTDLRDRSIHAFFDM